MTNEKWPPLDPGTRVKTTTKKTADSEWTPEALVARKWGVTGTVAWHHDSHGLCYDVRHDDGTEGCYDPAEFDVIHDSGEGRPVKDWGNCDRCGRPSECLRYEIEVLDHDIPEVCQTCKNEWNRRLEDLLNDFMRDSEGRKR